ncbi:MAG: SIMPL domain-containing protein [Burkholderiales bacterium]
MEKNSIAFSAVWGLFIGVGIVIAGWNMGNALYKARASERYVTVKGLAEREVDADLAIWPITFKEAGNDLIGLQRSVDSKRKLIVEFLEKSGFKGAAISRSAPRITDTQAELYGESKSGQQFRYVAQASITLRSRDVPLVKEAIEKSGELVSSGVVLVSDDWQNKTQFLYTSLNKIKPQMIASATLSAREAADKFAKDSGSKVGTIRKATQGLFEVTDRDANSPDRKNIRLVTTVEYFLIDD